MTNVIPFPITSAARVQARLGAFMAATGLRPARWSNPLPCGFDHTNVWRDRAGKIIITTEPYIKTAAHFAHLIEQGWTLADAPCEGMWNPPDARLILASPPHRGGDLTPLLEALA